MLTLVKTAKSYGILQRGGLFPTPFKLCADTLQLVKNCCTHLTLKAHGLKEDSTPGNRCDVNVGNRQLLMYLEQDSKSFKLLPVFCLSLALGFLLRDCSCSSFRKWIQSSRGFRSPYDSETHSNQPLLLQLDRVWEAAACGEGSNLPPIPTLA